MTGTPEVMKEHHNLPQGLHESLGNYLVGAGLLTERQLGALLDQLEGHSRGELYDLALKLGYLKPGALDAYLDALRDRPDESWPV
jgi:hypothetical protein